jgi:hypothetical protein
MKNQNPLILKFISVAITAFLLYVMVAIFIYDDFLNSLIPNWHKTLYQWNGALRTTTLILVSGVITYVLFTSIYKVLVYVQSKIIK